MKKQIKLFALLLGAALTISSCTRIDAGHEGILVKDYGSEKGVQDAYIVTGRVWYNPFTESVYQYPTFVQTVNYRPFDINAKDGSQFTVDPTISVYVETGKTPKIFKKYRKELSEIVDSTLYNYVKDAFRIQMNKYTTDEIVSKRERFEREVQNTLKASLKREGFILDQLTSGLKYPKSIIKAINNKNTAIQKGMEASNNLITDSINARRKIIRATAERDANNLRQTSLTPMLIQQQFIEKWDGKTPLYGENPIMMKQIK